MEAAELDCRRISLPLQGKTQPLSERAPELCFLQSAMSRIRRESPLRSLRIGFQAFRWLQGFTVQGVRVVMFGVEGREMSLGIDGSTRLRICVTALSLHRFGSRHEDSVSNQVSHDFKEKR